MSARIMKFPFAAQHRVAGVLDLFRKGLMSQFQGRVSSVEVDNDSRTLCRLQLSVGEVTVSGTSDAIPSGLQRGSWVRVRALRVYRDDLHPLHVTRMQVAVPHGTCAWVPTALCHREAHLRRLHALLDQLDPAMQAVFMTAVADAQVQRRFFWRVGAADHHCYPGGLFDQSVRAAETAFQTPLLTLQDRSVFAAAALLFDLGKTFDPLLSHDAPRLRSVLIPHRMTAMRLRHSYDAADLVRPGTGQQLRAVMECNPGSAVGGPPEVSQLAEQVRRAVAASYGLSK